ncbi:hypothetical protein KGA66_21150 [Actinocrinis puniceicyclus]|uniref:DUF2567 domain-containing protein n=1 Tax=Actinocrinis puniceicyclus TaxID=977794 RepID=A0A8J8BEW4_9ACTN|nr:hypothetical protein [Actinocrinis puniceicyclus]MBS2965571.1 hypothetical protein [Actinocrinis puniceicyclus]
MSTETPWPTPLPSPSPHDSSRPPSQPRWQARQEVAAFAVVTAASVLLAFGVGALWRVFAPAVLGVVNQGGIYYAAPEGKTFIARDGWFAALACIAAVLLALAAFLRYRRGGGLGAALGLAVGGIAGGYLAAWFGAIVGPGAGSVLRAARGVANAGSFALPMTLRATGAVWLWPAVAAGLFFFLMLLFGPVEADREPPGFPGWGQSLEGDGDGESDEEGERAREAQSSPRNAVADRVNAIAPGEPANEPPAPQPDQLPD